MRVGMCAMGIVLCVLFTFSACAQPDAFPKGTTLYKPDKCWNGYTLVPYEGGMILLIDMNGNVVHRWDIGTERATLLQDGHIAVM